MHPGPLALVSAHSATKWTTETVVNYVKLLVIIPFHFQTKNFTTQAHILYSKNFFLIFYIPKELFLLTIMSIVRRIIFIYIYFLEKTDAFGAKECAILTSLNPCAVNIQSR